MRLSENTEPMNRLRRCANDAFFAGHAFVRVNLLEMRCDGGDGPAVCERGEILHANL